MLEQIKDLHKFDSHLLGSGYDSALTYINHIIPLDILEFPSGTKIQTWTVPDEWIVKDAWVKYNGKKIIDYKENPFHLVDYSLPFKGEVDAEELRQHLHYSEERPGDIPYVFKFYDRDWGFCVPKDFLLEKIPDKCEGGTCMPELKKIDKTVGKIQIEGEDYTPKFKSKLKKGKYEVFIDTEFKKGIMKVGVHTIKGKTDKEILLFAHLDHPYQANDNLSGVVALMDLAFKLKDKYEHTIKIIFCPETIGSIAYASTQDISKVDFVISIDAIGNDNTLLFQKSFNPEDKINKVAHLAIQNLGESYRKATFRFLIGSDEYVFNDPKIGIPGIMLSRFPYPEYHTDKDTPEIIKEEMLEKVQKVIMKIIEIWEKDYIPERKFSGPLMRSKYDMQTPYKQLNLSHDYLIYSIDGKKSLAELCCEFALNFDNTYNIFEKLKKDDYISSNACKGGQ